MPRLRNITYKGKRWTIKVRSNTKSPRSALKSKPKKIRVDIGLIIRFMGHQYRRFIETLISAEKRKYIYGKLHINVGLGLPQVSSLEARDTCLVYLYYFEEKSADEIKENFGDFFINRFAKPMSRKGILNVMRKYKLSRDHEVSMFHRVAKGRMHYEKRSLKNRVINYVARDKKRGYLWAHGLASFIKKKGDIKNLAKRIGCSDSNLSSWKNLRRRVSADYQKKICEVLVVDEEKIFSKIKTKELPKLPIGSVVDHKKRLIEQGYRYATHLKEKIYQKGISITGLAKTLSKPQPSISRWTLGWHLVSPADQDRVAKIIGISKEEIFTV